MESSRRFDGMSEKVVGKVQEDFEKFSKRFQDMFEKNPGDLVTIEIFSNNFGDCY